MRHSKIPFQRALLVRKLYVLELGYARQCLDPGNFDHILLSF